MVDWKNNPITEPSPDFFNTAVKEVKAGRNVFTVTRVEAEMVAYVAGGKTKPMHDPKHEVTEPNYYDHYHIHDHANGAHVWYLF